MFSASYKQVCFIAFLFISFGINAANKVEIPEKVLYEINSYKLKKPIYRTKAESRALLESVIEKIYPKAKELCLSQGLDITKCEWDLEVVSGNQFNAYASGKNKISFYTGLVRGIHYEEELAFVVAHEIGHHIGDHLNKSKTRSIIGALFGAAIAYEAGIPSSDPAIIGANIGRMSYSKQQELEADAISLKILKDSGYDLNKARMGIVRLTRTGFSRVNSVFLDSHPSGPERVMWFDELSRYE